MTGETSRFYQATMTITMSKLKLLKGSNTLTSLFDTLHVKNFSLDSALPGWGLAKQSFRCTLHYILYVLASE